MCFDGENSSHGKSLVWHIFCSSNDWRNTTPSRWKPQGQTLRSSVLQGKTKQTMQFYGAESFFRNQQLLSHWRISVTESNWLASLTSSALIRLFYKVCYFPVDTIRTVKWKNQQFSNRLSLVYSFVPSISSVHKNLTGRGAFCLCIGWPRNTCMITYFNTQYQAQWHANF
jgi:hypothetical protein